MHSVRNLLKVSLFLVAVVIFCFINSVWALQEPEEGDKNLLKTYYRVETHLERNSFGLPLYLVSSDREGRLHVDVYGIFRHSFSDVLNVLNVPANWCDIASLHPNVKACTYRELPGAWQLTFYSGRKVYQSPEGTHQFAYRFRKVAQRAEYLDIVLNADEGPFGTKDHKMRFEAIPLDGERTFVHVSYAYRSGLSLRLAANIYFSTLGSGKVGFTVEGTDRNGNPVYVGGSRGVIERSAVRYYFAIQSFMDTLRYPEESRFSGRLSEWYDLTSRYRRQLFEMDKQDYLSFKTREHRNQVMLQQQISMSLP